MIEFRKRISALVLSSAMILSVTACGGTPVKSADQPSSAAHAEDSEWLKAANLDAEETPEELYEKAKAEGKVVITPLPAE